MLSSIRMRVLAGVLPVVVGLIAGAVLACSSGQGVTLAASPQTTDMKSATCEVLDTVDFWVVSGVWSEYGGMWCHF